MDTITFSLMKSMYFLEKMTNGQGTRLSTFPSQNSGGLLGTFRQYRYLCTIKSKQQLL